MRPKLFISFVFIISSLFGYSAFSQGFKTGNEVLLDSLHLLRGKNIGLITNSSSITTKGNHIISELQNKNICVKRIFTPEHGFNIDDNYGANLFEIETVSLYGDYKNISGKYLQDVDILIYDIQDLGVRFYTYTSTLYLTMKDAAEYGKEYIICDRPSVADLNYTGGYLLDNNFSSFVGMIPVPVIYGMTIGELGLFLKEQFKQELGELNIKVMKMPEYKRQSDFEKLNLKWINPSPNIRSLTAGRLYPALCFLEGTNISEGRGTENPFTLFGAPFCNSEDVISELKKYQLEGIEFEPAEFVPETDPAYSNPKFKGKLCYGVKIVLSDYTKYSPFNLAIAVLISLKKTCRQFQWTNKNFIDKLAGTDRLRKNIDGGLTPDEIIKDCSDELKSFNSEREKVLLYSK